MSNPLDRTEAPDTSVTGDQLLTITPAETIEIGGEAINPLDCFQPEERRPLGVNELMRLGATMPEGRVTSRDMEKALYDQAEAYKAYSKDELIAELVRRDESALRTGQEAADGRLQGRLIKEFLRGVLLAADHGTLREISVRADNKTGMVEYILQQLGAEKTDARMLKLYGTGLGRLPDGLSPEEAITSDQRVPQGISPATADQIRNNPNRTT